MILMGGEIHHHEMKLSRVKGLPCCLWFLVTYRQGKPIMPNHLDPDLHPSLSSTPTSVPQHLCTQHKGSRGHMGSQAGKIISVRILILYAWGNFTSYQLTRALHYLASKSFVLMKQEVREDKHKWPGRVEVFTSLYKNTAQAAAENTSPEFQTSNCYIIPGNFQIHVI